MQLFIWQCHKRLLMETITPHNQTPAGAANTHDDQHPLRGVRQIVTHPGLFHADDVCAVAYLRMVGCAAPVARRVPTEDDLYDQGVIVLDIGGTRDPYRKVFDHHQKGGAGARWDSDVPYAAFGLIVDWLPPSDDNIVNEAFDRAIVQPVDALDNGWGQPALGTAQAPTCSLSAAVSSFNPGPGAAPEDRDAAFASAVDWVKPVLKNFLKRARETATARAVVMAAETTADGRVLVLESFVPWAEHVFARPDQENLLYVVFPSERGGYSAQQVPVAKGSMEGRKPFPADWAGLRGKELADLADLPTAGDATFCHPGRFICGAETFGAVMQLVELALAAE